VDISYGALHNKLHNAIYAFSNSIQHSKMVEKYLVN